MEQTNYEPPKKDYRKETLDFIDHFEVYGIATILYGLLYCFCIYRNYSGVMVSVLAVGSIALFLFCLKKLEVPFKKSNCFYFIGIVLASVSNFLTDNGVMIFLNYCLILFLILLSLLNQYYATLHWTFSKFLSSSLNLAFLSLGNTHYPFVSMVRFQKKDSDKKSNVFYPIFIGFVIALPLAILVIVLLSSADAIFESIFRNILPKDTTILDFFGIIITFIIGSFGAYNLLSYSHEKNITEIEKDAKQANPIIAITFTSIISIIYFLFSAIQLCYLFFNNLSLPEGYNYSEYAREGFYQLLFVCLINLFLVLICLKCFQDHKVLKALLLFITISTYIMNASALFRMIMYIQEYALTFLRVFVLWSLLVIFLVLTGIVIHILNKNFPLFQYVCVCITLCYLILSFSKPDYYIALYNLKDYNAEDYVNTYSSNNRNCDVEYLYNLSLDATPALVTKSVLKNDYDPNKLSDNWYDSNPISSETDYYDKINRKYTKITFRTYNYSRVRAYELTKDKFKKHFDGIHDNNR